MGSVFQRGSHWYISFKQPDGTWKQASANTLDEKEAQKLLERVESDLAAQGTTGYTGPITIEAYAETWIKRRQETFEAKGTQFRDWKADRGRLDNYVLPKLGKMRLADVRPKHLAEFFHVLGTTTKLAPHTIRNIYSMISALFRDAAVAGHVDASPCILNATELGADVYVDSIAQGECRYTREQLELMISSPKIEEHERVFIAIGGLTGLRLGAIAGVRWSDLDMTVEPLGRLTSRCTYDGRPTKTGKPSLIPVHPTLAAILDAWKREGWERTYGRAPVADDLIVPRAPRKGARAAGTPHTEKTGGVLMDRCLEVLEIPKPVKKTHALRSTFISLAIEDDANDYLLEKVTHTTKSKSGRAFDLYAKPNWAKLCAEVAKLRILWKPCGGSGNGSGSQRKIVEAVGVEDTSPVLASTPGYGSREVAQGESAPSAIERSPASKTPQMDAWIEIGRALIDVAPERFAKLLKVARHIVLDAETEQIEIEASAPRLRLVPKK